MTARPTTDLIHKEICLEAAHKVGANTTSRAMYEGGTMLSLAAEIMREVETLPANTWKDWNAFAEERIYPRILGPAAPNTP